MKISEAIKRLQDIHAIYGDLTISGGHMVDDVPLRRMCVTDIEGMEVYPRDPNGVRGQNPIDGVFME